MSGRRVDVLLVLLLSTLLVAALPSHRGWARSSARAPRQPSLRDAAKTIFASLPVSFEPNRGQAPPSVAFLARSSGGIAYVMRQDMILSSVAGSLTVQPPLAPRPSRLMRPASPRVKSLRIHYLGGSGVDDGTAITADAQGNAWIVGTTTSPDFPGITDGSTPCGGSASQSCDDAFATELSPAGTLLYGRYLGGSGSDAARAVAVDEVGNAYVVGQTLSPDFPTAGGLSLGFTGGSKAFLIRLGNAELPTATPTSTVMPTVMSTATLTATPLPTATPTATSTPTLAPTQAAPVHRACKKGYKRVHGTCKRVKPKPMRALRR